VKLLKTRIDFVRNCTLSNSYTKHVLRASMGNKRGVGAAQKSGRPFYQPDIRLNEGSVLQFVTINVKIYAS
jgi:ligand-binding sensor protein